jgi:hypothetical protein
VGEISCPTKYFPEASSINFRRSCMYGLGVLGTAISFRLCRWSLLERKVFTAADQKLPAVCPMASMTVTDPLSRSDRAVSAATRGNRTPH